MQKPKLDRFTTVAGIITIASGLISLLSYLRDHLDQRVVYSLGIALVGAIVWLTLSAFKASRSFRSRAPLPRPHWLWPLLFDRLPAMSGLVTDPTQKTKVLVIYENSSNHILADLLKTYVDEHVELEAFECIGNQNPAQEEELEQLLSGADAAYMIWTRDMKNLTWPARLLSEWAVANSFKPILVVNMLLEEPYELPYVSLPKSKAVSGLWRLLARSSERGHQWRLRASSNRAAFITVCISFALLAAFTFSLHLKFAEQKLVLLAREGAIAASSEAKEKSELTDVTLMRITADRMWNTTESARGVLDELAKKGVTDTQKEGIRQTLNGYADLLRERLENQSPVRGAIGSVTFWRKIRLPATPGDPHEEPKDCVCEVAWSDGEKQTCFKYNESSIAGCAFQHGIQILYRSKPLQPQLPGAWSANGEAVGSWSGNGIFVANDESFRCFYDDSKNTNTAHTNLFCAAYVPRRVPESAASGVCAETVLESNILESARTRQILSDSLTALHVLPQTLIPTSGAVAECQRKWGKS